MVVINMGGLSLGNDKLNYDDIVAIYEDDSGQIELTLSDNVKSRVKLAHNVVINNIDSGARIYGVNTGFGKLVKCDIEPGSLNELQKRLVLSHATGVGDIVSESCTRVFSYLKLNSLSRGFSGISLETLNSLLELVNNQWLPRIPSKGSVGASGDLAPMAHWAATWLGYGEVSLKGEVVKARDALKTLGISSLELQPKDGLSIINGTQFSQAIALEAIINLDKLIENYLLTCALSIESINANISFLDARVQSIHPHATQDNVANKLRSILGYENRKINFAAKQDPYSFRCIPQVVGASMSLLESAREKILVEASSVTDNPIVDIESKEILSGGNFHGQYLGFSADMVAMAISELGSLSERRTAGLISGDLNDLPQFLIKSPGLNSGFMIVHVTSSALASENKHLANPLSTDSLPTSGSQEDHVSMSTSASMRLSGMIDNLRRIVSIEAMAASQALWLKNVEPKSEPLRDFLMKVREVVPPMEEDLYMGEYIDTLADQL